MYSLLNFSVLFSLEIICLFYWFFCLASLIFLTLIVLFCFCCSQSYANQKMRLPCLVSGPYFVKNLLDTGPKVARFWRGGGGLHEMFYPQKEYFGAIHPTLLRFERKGRGVCVLRAHLMVSFWLVVVMFKPFLFNV